MRKDWSFRKGRPDSLMLASECLAQAVLSITKASDHDKTCYLPEGVVSKLPSLSFSMQLVSFLSGCLQLEPLSTDRLRREGKCSTFTLRTF